MEHTTQSRFFSEEVWEPANSTPATAWQLCAGSTERTCNSLERSLHLLLARHLEALDPRGSIRQNCRQAADRQAANTTLAVTTQQRSSRDHAGFLLVDVRLPETGLALFHSPALMAFMDMGRSARMAIRQRRRLAPLRAARSTSGLAASCREPMLPAELCLPPPSLPAEADLCTALGAGAAAAAAGGGGVSPRPAGCVGGLPAGADSMLAVTCCCLAGGGVGPRCCGWPEGGGVRRCTLVRGMAWLAAGLPSSCALRSCPRRSASSARARTRTRSSSMLRCTMSFWRTAPTMAGLPPVLGAKRSRSQLSSASALKRKAASPTVMACEGLQAHRWKAQGALRARQRSWYQV